MSLAMSFVSAAYVVVQATEATTAYTGFFVEGYYFRYAGGSILSNNLGYYEVAAFILYAIWSFGLTAFALYQTGQLLNMLEVREVGVKKDGQGGVAMDDIQAMKFFTLEMVMGFSSIVAGFALGDVADQLLTWFDYYADDTKSEGQDKETGKFDPDGTSAEYDYLYHWSVLIYSYITFSAITVGGYWFGLNFMKWTDPTDCGLDDLSSTLKSELRSVLMNLKTPQDCYDKMPALMRKIDFNKNNILDRCEDATILFSVGNSKEYALTYSHYVDHALVKRRCDQVFNPLY